MEFKLNRIDSDIREKIEKNTKSDKIHAGEGSGLIKDLKDNEENKGKQYSGKYSAKRKKIVVECYKDENRQINIEAEKVETTNQDNSNGWILDTRK